MGSAIVLVVRPAELVLDCLMSLSGCGDDRRYSDIGSLFILTNFLFIFNFRGVIQQYCSALLQIAESLRTNRSPLENLSSSQVNRSFQDGVSSGGGSCLQSNSVSPPYSVPTISTSILPRSLSGESTAVMA